MKMLYRLFYHVDPGSEQERKVMKSAISMVGFILFFDQISKFMIVDILKNVGTRIQVIPGFFDLTYVTNTGAAWGILAGKGALLLVISIAVFVLLSFFLRQICEGWTERYYALLMVMSGILGNSIDRVARGAVVDFLRFHYEQKYEWPSFNIADCAITVGVAAFIISMLFRPEQKKSSGNAANSAK